MAELTIVEDERPGILKEIDEGAMDLIFQAIQEDIYSFPIKSFIREGISNGLDAIIEKHTFKAIKSGKPVSEFYLQRKDNKLLKDSGYDADYYEQAYLRDNDRGTVTYQESQPRDIVSIKDYGVGLGGSRLKGFFKLGYSSKRNMRHVIGKFGSGAKAGLATGVDYFIMHTVYNGYKTSFMIFKNDYESMTPFRDSVKTEIWTVKMANGQSQDREIYWEPSHEKNYVQIDLEAKKHNKTQFLSAVREQFQYFGGKVKLCINPFENNEVDNMDQAPDYESDAILIPRYSTYTAPHILVDGISYGLISWDELELERRQGKIAIKVAATNVDITQSRESLKWTEKTKKTILKAVKNAKTEAEEYVTESLKMEDDQDIFTIVTKYGNLTKNSDNIVSKVFSRFLDMHNITPKFPVRLKDQKEIKAYLGMTLFEFLFYSFDFKLLALNTKYEKAKISTEKIEDFTEVRNAIIIYAEKTSMGPKLVAHLLTKYDVNSLVYIRPNHTRIKTVLEYGKKEYATGTVREYAATLLYKYSTLFVDDYEVKYDEKEEDLDTKEVNTASMMSLLRKANKEVLYTEYLEPKLEAWYGEGRAPSFVKQQNKITRKISDLKNHFEGEKIIICTGKYKNLGRLIEYTQVVFNKTYSRVIYIAQENVRYFKNYGTIITDYFREVNVKTGELMIGEHIRNLNTWRITFQLLEEYKVFSTKFNILEALTEIDVKILQQIHGRSESTRPREVIEENSKMTSDVLDDVFGYLEGLRQFQDVVKTTDKKAIAKKAMELFNSDEIYHIDAYDEEFISTLRTELERLKPIEDILAFCEDYGNHTAAKPLFDLLLTTLQNIKDQ